MKKKISFIIEVILFGIMCVACTSNKNRNDNLIVENPLVINQFSDLNETENNNEIIPFTGYAIKKEYQVFEDNEAIFSMNEITFYNANEDIECSLTGGDIDYLVCYDADGVIQKFINYENTSSPKVKKYYEDGRYVEGYRYNKDDNVIGTELWYYDENGNVTEYEAYGLETENGIYRYKEGVLEKYEYYVNQKLEEYEEYVYDKNGMMIQKNHYSKAYNTTNDWYVHEFYYTYDENGNLIKELEYYFMIENGVRNDDSKILYNHKEWKYNYLNNLLTKNIYVSNKMSKNEFTEYVYNSQDKLLKVETYLDDKIDAFTEYEYRGNVDEEGAVYVKSYDVKYIGKDVENQIEQVLVYDEQDNLIKEEEYINGMLERYTIYNIEKLSDEEYQNYKNELREKVEEDDDAWF